MAANRTHTASAEWTKLEAEVRELDNILAAKWRKLSRLRWIREGDAPSKFFFSILKARRTQEEISTLVRDGTRLEDDDNILEELKQYYQDLYRQPPISEEDEELRRHILKLMHKRISDAQNAYLIEKPNEEEIEKLICNLKTEKAPGIDGMTAEVLQLLWRHAPGDVMGFVHKFWETGTLTWKQQTGVIKLIPKEGDRQRIKNWRPLTLLNTGYKRISKVMANRMKLVLPEIVDSQQKGFIQGAKLYLEKSTVIPVGMISTLQWLKDTGCYIAREGEPIRHGDVLCGENAQGKEKIPLLAWEALQPAKSDGGLDIPLFAVQGKAQKLRQVLRMVHHPGEDWMFTLGALLRWKIAKGREAASMRHWDIEEILMANCHSKIQGAKTTTGLLKVWVKVRTNLEIQRNDFTPKGETSAEAAIKIGEQQGWLMANDAKMIKATLRRHKVKTIGQWADWASWNDARRPLPQAEQKAVEVGLEYFPSSTPILSLPWTWKAKKRIGEWFTVTTKECKRLVGISRKTADSLNRKDTTDRWRDFRFLTEDLSCHIPRTACFIDTVDAAFRGQDPGKQVPFALHTRATWLDRNQVTYAQQRACMPVSITLKLAVEMLNSLRRKLEPTTKAAKKLEIMGELLQIVACRAGESEHAIEPATQVTEAVEVADWDEEDQTLHSQSVCCTCRGKSCQADWCPRSPNFLIKSSSCPKIGMCHREWSLAGHPSVKDSTLIQQENPEEDYMGTELKGIELQRADVEAKAGK
ncbi:hypothetical protein R1flu_014363 [Riccia fluitans]|uniref:Reverse transcriptase domain-containing protein n=1 Tax=Riccia fluitans TaxID=41844 RepID=A0ABD1YJN7_9MARC